MKNNLQWLINGNQQCCELRDLISTEFTAPNYSSLWQKRPSRLTSISPDKLQTFREKYWQEYNDEVERFPELLQINYYDNNNLELFFAKESRILAALNDDCMIKPGIYFPAVYEKEDKSLPIVSLSSFCKKTDYSDFENSPQKKSGQKLSKLLGNTEILYFPEIAMFLNNRKNALIGESYELAWFLKEYLSQAESSDISINNSIICTGIIDDSGNIKRINKAKEKFNAAIHFGFDYIFFPKSNKEELEALIDYEELLLKCKHKPLFFNDIYELKKELLNISSNINNREIPRWLATNQKVPESEEFLHYFKYNNDYNPISPWKKRIQSTSLDDKLKKLEKIISEYADYIISLSGQDNLTEFCKHLSSFAPKDYYYFAMPKIFEANQNKVFELEKQYFSISDKLVSNDNNTALASLRLNLNNIDLINNKFIDSFIRQYPALLGMFFNHTSELLFLIGNFSNSNYKKYKPLLKIISNCCKNSNYCISENELIVTILKELSESKHIDKVTVGELRTSQQLANLVKAKRLAKQGKIDLLRACEHYFKCILHRHKNTEQLEMLENSFAKINTTSDNIEKDNLPLEILMSSTEEQWRKFPEYKKALEGITEKHEISYNDELISLQNRCIKALSELRTTQSKAIQIIKEDLFPQPAFNLLSDQLKSHFHSYTKEIFEEAKKDKGLKPIKLSCLAYWHGYNSAVAETPILSPKKFEYFTAYLIGYIKGTVNSGKSASDLIRKLEKEIESCRNNNLFQFIWLKFLSDKEIPYKSDILYSKIQELDKCSDKNQGINIEAKILKAILFKEKVYLGDPEQMTLQLLLPIYKLLVEKNYCDNDFNTCGLNSCQFVSEFMRVFCMSDSPESQLFIPIHWRCSIDKQMFNTIAISYLQNNKNLLKNYLFEYVDDLPNLLLGFKLTKK